MADISDVEQALTNSVTAMLYPEGSSQASIAGITCRIYRGWPNTATLSSDLSAGIVNVTITSNNDSGKTTTRYLVEWQYDDIVPDLTASVTGQTIFIAGTAAVGNVVGALIDGRAFAYRISLGDTPDLIAANLCAAVQPTFIAELSGPRINMPGATSVVARVVNDNLACYEGRRQEKDVRVVLWCPNPTVRDSLAAAIDLSVAQSPFLLLSDRTNARMTYRSSATFDQSQNALLYRRDLVYTVEYATVISASLPSMLFGASVINGQITYG